MPQIITIRVVRRRSVQPEQYGSAAAEVEMTGNVLEGEDSVKVARQMLVDSRKLVYENLGMKLPKSAIDNAAEVDTPTETATVETSTEEKTEEKPKKRGRPKGSKNSTSKSTKKTADDDVPGDDDKSNAEEMQIRTNPEDRKNPDDDDVPGDDDKSGAGEETEADEGDGEGQEFTSEDLHKFINDSIKAGKLTVPQAKQMQREMGVARVRDLDTAEKVAKARNMIEKAIEANEAK